MEFIFTILVGGVIGLVDAAPMFVRKMDRASCWSAFIQYVVVTFIIFNTTLPQLNVADILVGPIVSLLMSLPVVVMIGKTERKAIPVVLINAIVLGFMISIIKDFSASWFV